MKYIGVDLGGTNIAAGIADESGKLHYRKSIPTGSGRDPAAIIKDMAQVCIGIMQDCRLQEYDIQSIGIGVPGTPDNRNGMVLYACNIGFNNVTLRSEMQKYIKLPVYIGNDANCAALAENMFGAAAGTGSSVTVTIGTGIGGGIILNNRIYNGFNNAAAEFGHMVTAAGGELCSCGRNGCWEKYASAAALIRQTKEAISLSPESMILDLVNGNIENIDAKTPFDAARRGDRVGQAVVANYIQYLADGVANIINILQPEVIVIGGGISREGEYLLNPLREVLKGRIYAGGIIPQSRVKTAQMGNGAGIIGAAMLGMDYEKTL